MAGNHLKRCALMRWSFSILNDNTKCLVWWVNNRNTEAGKTKTKVIQKASKGHQISTKTCQGLPKWCPGAKVQILSRFWLYFGSHFGSTFYQNSVKILQKRPPKINAGKVLKFYDKIMENHAKMTPKFNHKSCEIRHSRFLWFCKESNVFLSF